MPADGAPTVVILLVVMAGLLVWMILLALAVARRLTRIERQLADAITRQESATPSIAETATGGAFETFLKEDPARRMMPKGEQFAAYRQWRQANGLNWSNS